ncbi:MAG: hypothetical protein PQ975_11505 [Methanobacterium sp.]
MGWKSTKNGAEVKFRKKVTFEDFCRIVDGPETDAVELKKKVQRGERFRLGNLPINLSNHL